MTNKLAFFAEHPVFRNLTEEQLRALCRIVREYSFDEGSVIAFQRDMADRMVLVRNGRLYSQQIDQHGRVRDAHTRGYTANQYFGADWLFTPGKHPATITGSEPGHIFIISNEDFLQFLTDYPQAIEGLEPVFDDDGEHKEGLPNEAWDEASKLSLVERREKIGVVRLLPDEIVEYYSRRSIWFLFMRLFTPGLFLIILPLLIYYLVPDDSIIAQILRFIGITLPILIFGFIFLFRLLDWFNDFFVITNKHISQREFELRGFRTQLIKVPIEQIQSVSVLKPSFIANLFNIGTARVTTAAQVGTVLFDNIDNPIEVKDTLERLRRQVKEYDVAQAQTQIRQTMEAHFNTLPDIEPITPEEDMEPASFAFRTWFDLGQWFSNLYNWRQVDGATITYRKNRLVLLWDIIVPIFGFFILFVLIGILIYIGNIPSSAVLLIFIIPLMINLFWLIWRYEDWRNDIFQLTDLYVIDIDRKPFGFSESRKQAPLRNIQNINAERPGFWATIFDYGYVHIETAGADSDIVFELVPRPSQVLSEIFARLDTVRQAERRRLGKDRRAEYALLLDVYKQEMEQGRIPRRTPRDEV